MNSSEAMNLLRGGPEGVAEWNKRRPRGYWSELKQADLTGAKLTNADLSELDLYEANFKAAKLQGANLRRASLRRANLFWADLTAAQLDKSNLEMANLREANLSGANLSGAKLVSAILHDTNLSAADLSFAVLAQASLQRANVRDANFAEAIFASTAINSEIWHALHLDSAGHVGGSHISTQVLRESRGAIPEEFLRGCGLSDDELSQYRALGGAVHFYTCFISYSTADEGFATRIHNDLQAAGIRCWKWDHDARTGRSLWGEIDQAIRQYDKLVLLASESSLKSAPVNREIERALQQEDARYKRKVDGEAVDADVLFPLRLDDYIFRGWEHERKADVTKKVIADARGWDRDNAKYDVLIRRLIRDLKAA